MTKETEKQYPIIKIVPEILEILGTKNYSEKYFQELKRIYYLFSDYANQNSEDYYNDELGQRFLAYYYKNRTSNHRPHVHRVINTLNDYCIFGEVLRKTKPSDDCWNYKFKDDFKEYYEHIKLQGFSSGYLNSLRFGLMKFMDFLEENAVLNLSDVTSSLLLDFIGSCFLNCSKKHKSRVLKTVRGFFEYFRLKGMNIKIFGQSFPKVRYFEDSSKIPNIFTVDEMDRLVASVDRGSPIGKRDYAILQLATHYGLRDVDIRNLKFENIDWLNKTISIIQSKTKNPLSLPLLENVGWSIIEYIQNGRPKSNCQYIFIVHNAPYDKFVSTMSAIIEKYMRKAKIPIKPNTMPGFHAIRHGLACRMLQNNISLSTIKEVLGHELLSTTNQYQKIDLTQLSLCALEVPPCK